MQRKHIIDGPGDSEAAADPMDIWLKDQLGGLHSEMLSEQLPDELGALAAALEARLKSRRTPVPAGDDAGAEASTDDPETGKTRRG